jgi:hypothetical protein
MAIWALLGEKSELVNGEVEPWIGRPLVCDIRETLAAYHDALPYAKGKLLRLVELAPRRELGA